MHVSRITVDVRAAGSAGAGPFTPKPPFWERPAFFIWPAAAQDPAAEEARWVAEDPANFTGAKKDCDRSRGTLTRTGEASEFQGLWWLCFVFVEVAVAEDPANFTRVKKHCDRSRGMRTRTGEGLTF